MDWGEVCLKHLEVKVAEYEELMARRHELLIEQRRIEMWVDKANWILREEGQELVTLQTPE